MLPVRAPHDMTTTRTKIYINPNFRVTTSNQNEKLCRTSTTTHLNPLFLERHNEYLLVNNTLNRIHMNPDFISNLKLGDPNSKRSSQMLQSQSVTPPIPEEAVRKVHCISSVISSDNPASNTNNRRIIHKSRTQLVREPADCKLELKSQLSSKPQLVVVNKNKVIRKVTKTTIKRPLTTPPANDNNINRKLHSSKYKLDNRQSGQCSADYVGNYDVSVSSFKTCRKPSTERYKYKLTKSIPTKVQRKTTKFSFNKRLQLLNINGLLYKSTKNCLKLNDLKKSNETKTISKCVDNQTQNSSSELKIYIRGTKYVMDSKKLKLTRVSGTDENISSNIKIPPVISSRIDIGGFTYVSNSSAKNVFIRTENHLARAYVTNTKQKCLQMLTKHRVKTNIPCLIYQRLGKCVAYERSKCSKDHSRHKVNVCSRFLRGECIDSNCLLSHNVSLSKMPVCKYYLQGICVRNKCPYLHKKLSNNAEICMDFLRGYCDLADKCNKRHEFLCLEFEQSGKCTNTKCNYCKKRKSSETRMELKKVRESLLKAPKPMMTSDQPKEENRRYFLNAVSSKTNSMNNDNDDDQDGNSNMVIKGKKLGILPSYIPL